MDRRHFLTTSTFVALGLPAGAARTVPRSRPRTFAAGELDRWREVTKVPGLVVAGMIDGTPVAVSSGGKRAGGDAVTADTLFPAASLSKPLFALAVRNLVQEGRLAWDKPLQDVVDLGLSGEARGLTAAHVLTHSTGLPNWRFRPDQPLAVDFAPGSRWQYSGEGFVLLQRAVEAVTGISIAAYLTRSVLAPLQMSSSTFAWMPAMEADAAAGHDRTGAPLEKSLSFYSRNNHAILEKAGLNPATARYDEIVEAYKSASANPLPVAISPNVAGSLMTTANDYVRFLRQLTADAAARPDEFAPRVAVNPLIGWTLGLGVDRTSAAPALFQWGDGPGFKHLTWIVPKKKTHLVLFTNGDRGAALYGRVFRQLVAEDPATLYWI
jgi:CubicO group peptidase (beta-lactamase class C family)